MVRANDFVIREEDTFTLPKQPLEWFEVSRSSLENQLSAMANIVDLGKARVKREVEKEPSVLSAISDRATSSIGQLDHYDKLVLKAQEETLQPRGAQGASLTPRANGPLSARPPRRFG